MRQKGRIIRLRSAGVDTLDAETTLRLLEANLQTFDEHRRALKSEQQERHSENRVRGWPTPRPRASSRLSRDNRNRNKVAAFCERVGHARRYEPPASLAWCSGPIVLLAGAKTGFRIAHLRERRLTAPRTRRVRRHYQGLRRIGRIGPGQIRFIGQEPDATTATFTQTSGAGGLLQVASGSHVVDLHLTATYTTANFALASDSAHGTLVTFVPNASLAGPGSANQD